VSRATQEAEVIDRDEYVADQRAMLLCIQRLLEVIEQMVEAATTRDEVATGARIQNAAQAMTRAKREFAKLSMRPQICEMLEGWSEDELDVLREKLGLIEDDEDDEDEDG
jgi:hypothetical protein